MDKSSELMAELDDEIIRNSTLSGKLARVNRQMKWLETKMRTQLGAGPLWDLEHEIHKEQFVVGKNEKRKTLGEWIEFYMRKEK